MTKELKIQLAKQEIYPEYLSLRELEIYCGVSRNTLNKWLSYGMPCFKVDRCIRVKKSEFDHWMQQYRRGTELQDLDSLLSQVLEEVQQ